MTTRKEISQKIKEVKTKMRETKKTDREEYSRLHEERIKLEAELIALRKAHAIEEDRIIKIKQRKIIDHKKFIMGGLCVKYFGNEITPEDLELKFQSFKSSRAGV
ncbi:MAG: hypothetical protein M0016_00260 [Deltaproteobacteria bacterium]|jgi:hypothetical protein|nr:hypothetical protein [Deltaproteobacteria bacterium]MCL5880939.1 hypothetical protein [Deltaproteobacteria bacterium]MDA8303593.1 hypothetical protein [Deltaproteobacteria bacterium]